MAFFRGVTDLQVLTNQINPETLKRSMLEMALHQVGIAACKFSVDLLESGPTLLCCIFLVQTIVNRKQVSAAFVLWTERRHPNEIVRILVVQGHTLDL